MVDVPVRLAKLHLAARPRIGTSALPVLPIMKTSSAYNSFMTKHKDKFPPEVEEHLEYCQQVSEQMRQDGTWPWKKGPDSTLSEDLVDSEGNQKNV